MVPGGATCSGVGTLTAFRVRSESPPRALGGREEHSTYTPRMERRRGSTYVAAAAAVIFTVVAWVAVTVEHSAEPGASTLGSMPSDDEPEAEVPTAVFIGDSYTRGVGSTGAGFVTLVARAKGWEAVNLGRGGTGYLNELTEPKVALRSCGMDYCPPYAGVLAEAGQLDAEVVVVSGGRNDAGSDRTAVAAAIDEFFVDLREALPRARIYATSPIWDDDGAPAGLKAISAEVRESVQAVGGTYLDIGRPLAGEPGLVSEDGVHPNDEGHAAIAEAIVEALPS